MLTDFLTNEHRDCDALFADAENAAHEGDLAAAGSAFAAFAESLRQHLAIEEEVLFPAVPVDATLVDRARFERAAALAQFFGGQARMGAEASAPAAATELPKLTAPVAPGPSVPAAPKRKKKEGC